MVRFGGKGPPTPIAGDRWLRPRPTEPIHRHEAATFPFRPLIAFNRVPSSARPGRHLNQVKTGGTPNCTPWRIDPRFGAEVLTVAASQGHTWPSSSQSDNTAPVVVAQEPRNGAFVFLVRP